MKIIFNNFVDTQIKAINSYINYLDNILKKNKLQKNSNFEINNNKNFIKNIDLSKILENQKQKILDYLQKEKTKIKEQIGFFPKEENYNAKIEKLFQQILNKKIITYSKIKVNNDEIISKINEIPNGKLITKKNINLNIKIMK